MTLNRTAKSGAAKFDLRITLENDDELIVHINQRDAYYKDTDYAKKQDSVTGVRYFELQPTIWPSKYRGKIWMGHAQDVAGSG